MPATGASRPARGNGDGGPERAIDHGLGPDFLVLGDERAVYPLFDRISVVIDPRDPFDAMLLVAPLSEASLVDILARAGRWLTPVVNLSGVPTHADDFFSRAPTDLALQHALDAIAPIFQRMEVLAQGPGICDEPGLRALAMAHTRARALEAQLAPHRPELVAYPLMRGIDDPGTVLTDLARSNLVEPHFFQRMHVCAGCGSSRMSVREECIDCRSSHLVEESLIHHYRCGHQATESQFRQGRDLVCPKCSRGMHHYAVDYDKPGSVQVCQACGTVSSEPAVGFLCADCAVTQDGANTGTRDWFHYSLLPAALDALRHGVLPQRSMQNLFIEHFGALHLADFRAAGRLLASIARRHQRPISGLTLHVRNVEAITAQTGQAGLNAVYRQLGEIITQVLRDSDLVTALDGVVHSVLAETTAEQCATVQRRIEAEIQRVMSIPVDLEVHRMDLDDIQALCEDVS